MSSLIEIQYNPFIPKLMILINGYPPSQFSTIGRYYNQDIWNWGVPFLDSLKHEIHDDLYIRFTGTKEDYDLLVSLLQGDNSCIDIEYVDDKLVGGTTQKRLVRLNSLFNHKQEKRLIKSLVVVDDDLNRFIPEIISIDINNRFCQVKQSVLLYSKFNRIIDQDVHLFFITNRNDLTGLETIDSQYPKHIISLKSKKDAVSWENRYYLYAATQSNVIDTLFEGYLRYPLLIALRSGIEKLTAVNIDTKDVTEIVEPIKIEIEKYISCGESIPIRYSCKNGTVDLKRINIKILDEAVAYSDKMSIFGKKIGSTVFEVYRVGEFTPFYSERIFVTNGYRVKQLLLDDSKLAIGIGRSHLLKYHCYPEEAHNASIVKWKTTNNRIALVDDKGVITGVSEGKCQIICSAENISNKCEVIILPFLKDIVIISPDVGKNSYFEMEPFEEVPLTIRCVPENAIDNKIVISTSNTDVVNVVGNRLIAKKRGVSTITIMNDTHTCELVIRIKVVKKLFFNRRIKK